MKFMIHNGDLEQWLYRGTKQDPICNSNAHCKHRDNDATT